MDLSCCNQLDFKTQVVIYIDKSFSLYNSLVFDLKVFFFLLVYLTVVKIVRVETKGQKMPEKGNKFQLQTFNNIYDI